MSNVKLTTNLGDIEIELFDKAAPKTVANFLEYVKSGFYEKTIFHRVISGFMVQGGGFTTKFEQKKGNANIENEATNKISNKRGTLAMARTPDPHSASSQFFINLVNNDFLDFQAPTQNGFGYCVFGSVVNGMEIVDKMGATSTGKRGIHADVPKEDIIILKAQIL